MGIPEKILKTLKFINWYVFMCIDILYYIYDIAFYIMYIRYPISDIYIYIYDIYMIYMYVYRRQKIQKPDIFYNIVFFL